MTVSDITQILEDLAHPSWQEDYDNCGLIIGSPDDSCTGVLVSLDVTTAVVEEAVRRGSSLIVAHHPLIFRGLKQIGPATGTGRAVISAISNRIAVYAIHTSLDNVLPGVNSEMALRLGLHAGRPLLDRPASKAVSPAPGQMAGSGLIGELAEPVTGEGFLRILKQVFGTPLIRHSALTSRAIRRVAICGGAGSFLIDSALRQNADAFVTADLKYHEFFAAEGKMLIADAGHFETEQFTVDFLVGEIRRKKPNFAVLKAETRTNPVHYYL